MTRSFRPAFIEPTGDKADEGAEKVATQTRYRRTGSGAHRESRRAKSQRREIADRHPGPRVRGFRTGGKPQLTRRESPSPERKPRTRQAKAEATDATAEVAATEAEVTEGETVTEDASPAKKAAEAGSAGRKAGRTGRDDKACESRAAAPRRKSRAKAEANGRKLGTDAPEGAAVARADRIACRQGFADAPLPAPSSCPGGTADRPSAGHSSLGRLAALGQAPWDLGFVSVARVWPWISLAHCRRRRRRAPAGKALAGSAGAFCPVLIVEPFRSTPGGLWLDGALALV